MIASDLETGVARLRDLLERAKVVLPFTGAGISTECGIPDFRSPDLHSIELLQKGDALPPKEPWTSMPNTGKW